MKKFAIIFLSTLIIPSFCKALTLSEIRTEIRRNVNDNPTSSTRYRYSDASILVHINQAQKEIVNATWLCEKTSSYVLSPNTTFYNLPTDLISIIKLDFLDKSGYVELKETTLKELMSTNVEWQEDTGPPTDYYVSQTTSSSLEISYIPIPTLTSTGTVTIRYYNQVADLSSDSDVPFDSKRHLYPYHNTIVNYVTAKIKIIEGRTDQAGLYLQMFGNDIKVLRDRINALPNYNPSMVIDSGRK